MQEKQYIVITLHRPSNVNNPVKLKQIIEVILNNVDSLPVIFPIHPKTAKAFKELGITSPNMYIVDPMGYLEFNYLFNHSKAVITDSGSITKEATIFGLLCLTLRENTEIPETCDIGINELAGIAPENIKLPLKKLFEEKWKKAGIPELWMVKLLQELYNKLQHYEVMNSTLQQQGKK